MQELMRSIFSIFETVEIMIWLRIDWNWEWKWLLFEYWTPDVDAEEKIRLGTHKLQSMPTEFIIPKHELPLWDT